MAVLAGVWTRKGALRSLLWALSSRINRPSTWQVPRCPLPQAVADLHKGPYLVFGGKTGWIGQKMVTLLKERGCEAIAASSRLENRSDVEA